MRSSLRPWSGLLPGLLFCGLLGMSFTLPAEAQEAVRNGGDFSSNTQPAKVPSGVLIVKGAWFSARQAKGITDALMQWRFKPYLSEAQAVEVETGIMFGRAPRGAGS